MSNLLSKTIRLPALSSARRVRLTQPFSTTSESSNVPNPNNSDASSSLGSSVTNETSSPSPGIYRLQRSHTKTKSSNQIASDNLSISSPPVSSEEQITAFTSHLHSATARHRKNRRKLWSDTVSTIDGGERMKSNHDDEIIDNNITSRKLARGSVVAHMSATAKYRRSRVKLSSSTSVPNPSSISILNASELEDQFKNLQLERAGEGEGANSTMENHESEEITKGNSLFSRFMMTLGIQNTPPRE